MTNQRATSQSRAEALALLAVLFWSSVATAFKLSLRWMDVVQLVTIATLTSTLVLGVAVCVQRRLGEAMRLLRADTLRCVLLGLLNPVVYYLVLLEAYDRLPAQEAQALNYTWAVTYALLAVPLLGQKLRGRDLLGLLVGYLGVVVIAMRGGAAGLEFSHWPGVALALVSSVLWSLYWIAGSRDTAPPAVRLFLNFLMASPCVVVLYLFRHGWELPSMSGWLGAIYVGVFEMGLTFLIWQSALRRSTHQARIASLIYLSPFLSLFFIRKFVGEPIAASTLVGLALILLGAVLQRWPQSPRAR